MNSAIKRQHLAAWDLLAAGHYARGLRLWETTLFSRGTNPAPKREALFSGVARPGRRVFAGAGRAGGILIKCRRVARWISFASARATSPPAERRPVRHQPPALL